MELGLSSRPAKIEGPAIVLSAKTPRLLHKLGDKRNRVPADPTIPRRSKVLKLGIGGRSVLYPPVSPRMLARMQVLDFNKLSGRTRQRLIAALARQTSPTPLFQDPHSFGMSVFGWGSLSALGLVILAFCWFNRFGSTYNFHQKAGFIAGYITAFFCIFAGIAFIVRNVFRKKASVAPGGVYVFPLDVIEIDGTRIELFSMGDLLGIRPVHHYRNGFYQWTKIHFSFPGKTYTFTAPSIQYSEQLLNQFQYARAQVRDALERRDMDAIGALDLFIEERMTNQWQAANPADGPQGKAVPMLLGYPALLAVVPAILLAIPSWGIRNYASDEKAYKAVMAYPTFYGCDDYIREEGRHLEEANTFCLARASMREIQSLDSASLGYRALKKKFPAPALQGELEQGFQKALANEFALAKTKNTVDAYRKFLHDAPDARQAPDAKKAIHAAYQRALTNYGKKTNTSDTSIIPFMAELVDQLEKNDSPPVAVSFERVPTKSLDVADRLLASDAGTGGISGLGGLGYGGFAKASTFFDATHAKHREDTLVTQLQKAFTGVFPEDMLRFAKDDGKKAKARRSVLEMSAVELEDELKSRNSGKYFDSRHFGSGTSTYPSTYGTKTTPAKVDTTTITSASPTMHVKYTVDWSGTTYKDSTSGRRFVGIIINFDVAMDVDSAASKHAAVCPPTKAAPLASGSFCPIAFKLEVRPPASFEVKYSKFMDNNLIGSGNPSDSLVYEVMAAQAYEQLSTKLHDAFFATEADLRAKAKADAAATGGTTDDDDDDDEEEGDAPAPAATATPAPLKKPVLPAPTKPLTPPKGRTSPATGY